MTSYNTGSLFDSHWRTPPPDPTGFVDQTAPSYDDQLLDVFQSGPFPPYSTSIHGVDDAYAFNTNSIDSSVADRSTPSDAADSPQGNLSYASSAGYPTSNTSFSNSAVGAGMDFDLNSIFTAPSGDCSINGDSPPFDFGTSLACDFDTSGLRGLFSNQTQPQIVQAPFHQPVQGFPPSSTSASPPQSFPLSSDYLFQLQSNSSLQGYPAQYLAPAGAASVAHSYPTPSRNPSISSGASPSALSSGPTAEEDSSNAKRRRVTLAETAGIVPLQQTAAVAPTAFAVQATHYPQASTISSSQPRLGRGSIQTSLSKPKSPVELIANAGISNASVHHPPTYQLLPKPMNAASAAAQGKGKRANPAFLSGTASVDDKSTGGTKRKKTNEKGHNAVEQKYRNSINNALATLRDTIPALRHLKPLPSMPVSKRKASQFTLPSSIANATPEGLVDGVTPAKTLSKGVILNKAIEYIDFLRFARESHTEDIEILKEMVKTMVGGGDQLVAEFEKKRGEREIERLREREAEREEGEGDDDGSGDGEEEDEDEEDKAVPAASKTKKASTGPKKRGAAAKKDNSPSMSAKPMAASAIHGSTISLPSQQLSPPLTSEYRHIQALNAAHLESLASSAQPQTASAHTFPPSPVSSDDHSVSPAALVPEHAQREGPGAQRPRVLLASFMGVSFAGGVGYDWSAGSTAAAAGEASELIGSAWTSRLARRSFTTADGGSALDLVHPSILTGLIALGIASTIVSLVCVVYPLVRSTTASASASRPDSRRSRALSILATSSTSSDTSPSTFAKSRSAGLAARQELLEIVGAPSSIALVPSLLRETLVWVFSTMFDLHWNVGRGNPPSPRAVERAVAWVRVAEIEATVGGSLSTLSRLYTFLHLSNLARSPAWPQVSAATSSAAVTALLSTHLLSLGHPRWAQKMWSSTLSARKKSDATIESDTFVEIALDADFETVQILLDGFLSSGRLDEGSAMPSDTVPLLRIAEAVCADALEDVWSKIFASIVDSTCDPEMISSVPPQDNLKALTEDTEIGETLEVVFKSSVEGSEVRSLVLMTKALLDTLSTPREDSQVSARLCIRALLSEAKRGGVFGRLASALPLCQLLLPSVPADVVASFPPLDKAINNVDHLAATTLSWLVLRRENIDLLTERQAYPSPPPSPTSKTQPRPDKVNYKVHAQAIAVRQLLAHDVFRNPENSSAEEGPVDLDDAKELLVDALTSLARRAAGLTSRDDDSGVEL